MKKVKPGYKLVKNFFKKQFEIPNTWNYPKFNEVVKTNPSTEITGKIVPHIPMDAVDVSKPHFNYFEEQQKIAAIISKIDNKIVDLKLKKTNLEILKKGLMQKLLTGERRVNV